MLENVGGNDAVEGLFGDLGEGRLHRRVPYAVQTCGGPRRRVAHDLDPIDRGALAALDLLTEAAGAAPDVENPCGVRGD